ncbi:MAG: AAA family ATPase [Rubrivivax sp.]|nr:AAA family ATPase [Rubrivivax sp.]
MLGPVALLRDGQALSLPTRNAQALLLVLALAQPTPRDRLASWLWPGLDSPAARRNLRRELQRLRDAGADELLTRSGGIDGLHADRLVCDVHDLERACAGPHGPGVTPGEPSLHWPVDAVLAEGLHAPESGAFDAWLMAERARVTELLRQAARLRAAALAAEGQLEPALHAVQELLRVDALQENLHREAMRLLVSLGRREEALAQFVRCKRTLSSELGLEPMPETEALARSIRSSRSGSPGPAALRQGASSSTFALRGRTEAWRWMQAAWQAGTVMLLEGEAGAGKTRLAHEFLSAQGALAVACCRAEDAESPYASFVRLLRVLAGGALGDASLPLWMQVELAYIVPELGPAPRRVATPADQLRLQEAAQAAFELLSHGSFDAVLVDDFHLADAASRPLFQRLASNRRRDAQAQPSAAAEGPAGAARMVFTQRPSHDAASEQAGRTLQQGGAALLRLEPLVAADVQAMVREAAGLPSDGATSADADAALLERLGGRLHAATGGNAFYASETLRHWVGLGLLRGAGVDEAAWPFPASVRDAVLARVRMVPAAATRLLDAAVLTAEPFTPRLLAEACALSELEAIDALEQALAARMLRVQGDGYAFAHDLVRLAVDGALAPERRRLVHLRLALAGARVGLGAEALAVHFEQGGQPSRAVEHRMRAAVAALQSAAFDQARAHWRHALDDGPTPRQRFEILSQQVRCERVVDAAPAMQAALEELLRWRDQWQTSPQTAALALEASVEAANALSMMSRYQAAIELTDEVLGVLPRKAPLRAHAMLVRSQALIGLLRLDEGTDEAEAALRLSGSTPAIQADLRAALIWGYHRGGQPQKALPHAQHNLQFARLSGSPRSVARALSNLGLIQSGIGDVRQARHSMEQALDQARLLRMVELQRLLCNNLGNTALERGEPVLAARYADEGIRASATYSGQIQESMLRSVLAQAHYQQGHIEAAKAEAGVSIALARETADSFQLLDSISMTLDIYTTSADYAAADTILALAGPSMPDTKEGARIKLAFNRVRLALAKGDLAHAREVLGHLPRVEELHELTDRQNAAVCWAEYWLAGRPTRAREALEALDGVTSASAPWVHIEVGVRAAAARLMALAHLVQHATAPAPGADAVPGTDLEAELARAAVAADRHLQCPKTPRPLLPILAAALATLLQRPGNASSAQ